MISHRYKVIFIHVPKCAGTSIEHAFAHDEGIQGRGTQDHRTMREIEPVGFRSLIHAGRDDARLIFRRLRSRFRQTSNPNNLLTVTRDQYQSYFKFSIVRNPYSRAYSWYRAVMRDAIMMEDHGLDAPIGFEEFLTRFLGKKGLMRPATWFLNSFGGKMRLDFVGKFENLSEDFDSISNRLGLGIALPHKLKGSVQDWRAAYDETTTRIVRNYYREDFETFGYSDQLRSPNDKLEQPQKRKCLATEATVYQ
ncbi:MAG: sulfotransferase family 2 domain-containing protein, partial [Wenzhouxiangella sp.]